MHEEPSQRQLTFSLIQSAFMKEFVGSWHVQPGAEGLTEVRRHRPWSAAHCLAVRGGLASAAHCPRSAAHCHCRCAHASLAASHTCWCAPQVRHRLSVRPSLAPPQKIGDITKKVFKKQVRREVQRRRAAWNGSLVGELRCRAAARLVAGLVGSSASVAPHTSRPQPLAASQLPLLLLLWFLTAGGGHSGGPGIGAGAVSRRLLCRGCTRPSPVLSAKRASTALCPLYALPRRTLLARCCLGLHHKSSGRPIAAPQF